MKVKLFLEIHHECLLDWCQCLNNGSGGEAVVGEELGFVDELMSECV